MEGIKLVTYKVEKEGKLAFFNVYMSTVDLRAIYTAEFGDHELIDACIYLQELSHMHVSQFLDNK